MTGQIWRKNAYRRSKGSPRTSRLCSNGLLAWLDDWWQLFFFPRLCSSMDVSHLRATLLWRRRIRPCERTE